MILPTYERAGTARETGFGGVFLQSMDQKRSTIELYVIFHQIRVAAILQLAQDVTSTR